MRHMHALTLASAKHLHSQGYISKATHDSIVGKASTAMTGAPDKEPGGAAGEAVADPMKFQGKEVRTFGAIGRPEMSDRDNG